MRLIKYPYARASHHSTRQSTRRATSETRTVHPTRVPRQYVTVYNAVRSIFTTMDDDFIVVIAAVASDTTVAIVHAELVANEPPRVRRALASNKAPIRSDRCAWFGCLVFAPSKPRQKRRSLALRGRPHRATRMRRGFAVAHTAHARLNALRSTSRASVGGFQLVASGVRAFARASAGAMGRFGDVPEAPKVRARARDAMRCDARDGCGSDGYVVCAASWGWWGRGARGGEGAKGAAMGPCDYATVVGTRA